MKNDFMIALYNESNHLVGYFKDNKEVDEYLDFMKKREINTEGWKRNEYYFNA